MKTLRTCETGRRRRWKLGGPTLRRALRRVVMLVVIAASAPPVHALTTDSRADFVAHTEHGKVVVDRLPPGASVAGHIEATRRDDAIELHLNLADGSMYRIGPFERVDVSPGPEVLGPPARTTLDVRGTYRADVRDETGAPIGWFRVRIDPPDGAARVYEGNLPPALDGSLAVAAAQLLGIDVDELEAHAVDVHLGN